MSTLVILRFTGIFAAYTGITVLLPEIMFRRILKGRRLSEQFLMSYTFGNFYIINIVFALQLLHISNFFTLTAVTVLMSILIGVKVNRVPLRRKLAEGKKILQAVRWKSGYQVCCWKISEMDCRCVQMFGRDFL